MFVLCAPGVVWDVGGDGLVVRVLSVGVVEDGVCVGATITKSVTVFVITRDICTLTVRDV